MSGRSDVVDVSAWESLSLLRRSLTFVRPYVAQVFVKLVLSLIGVSVALALPWPFKMLVDHVVMDLPIGESPTPYPPYVEPLISQLEGLSAGGIVAAVIVISIVSIILIGASLGARDSAQGELAEGMDTATRSENLANVSNSSVGGLLGLFEYRYQLRTTHGINHDLRRSLYDRLLAQPMVRFTDASIGDAVYRVMYDTPSISRVCYDILVTPLVSLYSLGVILWTTEYSFSAVPSLVAVAWLAGPIVLLLTLLMTGTARRRSIASRTAGAATTANVEEGMSNITAVQALGANDRQIASFGRDSDASFKRFRSFEILNLLAAALGGVVPLALAFYLFFEIVDALIDGRMAAGDYVVVFGFFSQFAASAAALGAMWFNLQNSVAGMKRVFDVLDSQVDKDTHGRETLSGAVTHVAVERASFSYPDGTRALMDVSFEGRVGEMIALVGPTGAGKTTLAYLVPGFVQPEAGRVTLNGVDLNTLSVDTIRENVAFVFQEPVVFDDTVRANVALGNPNASEADIEAALASAGALEFARALPEGLDTRLGQGGARLSVGQKQRLAIARGLLSEAPILILDEPTAALDPETENALVNTLQNELGNRLLIVIAHRLSTIRSADRVVFVEAGRVVETGTHEELMAIPGGAYRRFVELQLGEAA
jgi:ABC-type multidrug transport system fused ATPase/permease subunit